MPNVHMLLSPRNLVPHLGDPLRPRRAWGPSPPQAPLPQNLSLVPEPQTPTPFWLPVCPPLPAPQPSPHTPAESLGSTVKTTGFGISV